MDSATAPMSPEAATTVTWRLAAAWSAAFTLLAWARLTQCSPPICPAALIDMTPPSVLPRRSEPTAAETAFVGAVQGRRRKQEDDQGGTGGERVHHLDVQHLLAESQPGGTGPGERGEDPHPRGRQVEQAVEGRHVLAHVGDVGRVQPRFGEFGQHHGLAAAVDPAVEERLDAVGHLELLRRVAGGDRVAVGGPGWAAGRPAAGLVRRCWLRLSGPGCRPWRAGQPAA